MLNIAAIEINKQNPSQFSFQYKIKANKYKWKNLKTNTFLILNI